MTTKPAVESEVELPADGQTMHQRALNAESALHHANAKVILLRASLAAANERADEAFNEGVEAAAACDPWKAHLAHNPLASILSSPRQCVEVMRKLMRELKRPVAPPSLPTNKES